VETVMKWDGDGLGRSDGWIFEECFVDFLYFHVRLRCVMRL
jgi:hypothetical protein